MVMHTEGLTHSPTHSLDQNTPRANANSSPVPETKARCVVSLPGGLTLSGDLVRPSGLVSSCLVLSRLVPSALSHATSISRLAPPATRLRAADTNSVRAQLPTTHHASSSPLQSDGSPQRKTSRRIRVCLTRPPLRRQTK